MHTPEDIDKLARLMFPEAEGHELLEARGKAWVKVHLGTEALIKSLGWGEMGRVRAERAVVAVLMAVGR